MVATDAFLCLVTVYYSVNAGDISVSQINAWCCDADRSERNCVMGRDSTASDTLRTNLALQP